MLADLITPIWQPLPVHLVQAHRARPPQSPQA